LTRAGHEIRNPLHGISAGVETCLSGELSPAELRTELLAVSDGVSMMTALTNDLLDLQKMRMGKFSVHEAIASPMAMVEACVRAVQPAVSMPIELSIDAGVPPEVCACRSAAHCSSSCVVLHRTAVRRSLARASRVPLNHSGGHGRHPGAPDRHERAH
jgi:signal transduction histidine kinase